ncbi:hypothetical protein [Saccharothrix variisporea]|uniref:Uncharacterized protein n=1 Tax=Saccharothrix variisporea TaxID=543527 RepID=A0A495XHA5_9PSEU|nr:hypothetical protein [Saccharothrix variisporea]RKT72485.1 hypothetical protein DFJ66_5799 [Saccharothrix variisporea]
MTDTESLIRDALLRQAERTPPPGGVLAALRRPRRSRKPLLLALATAATATAVAVAVTAIPRPTVTADAPVAGQSSTQQTPAPTTTTSPATTTSPSNTTSPADTTSPAPDGTLSLEFSVGWVPEGLTERHRAFTETGIQRMWGTTASVTGQSVRFQVAPDGALPGTATDPVNGAPASLTEHTIHWRLGGRLLSADIQGVPDGQAALRRFAESVRPDPTRFTAPVRAKDLQSLNYLVQDSGDWTVGGVVVTGEKKYSIGLATSKTAELSPVTTSTELTAMGRPAVYEDGRYSSLTVTLAPQRLLFVSTLKDVHAPAEELIAVLEKVQFVANPDMSWVGH